MTTICGVEVLDIPEEAVAVEVIVLIKALDEDGDPSVYTRTSEGLSAFEAVGMLQLELDRRRDLMLDAFRADGDGDGDDLDLDDEDEDEDDEQ